MFNNTIKGLAAAILLALSCPQAAMAAQADTAAVDFTNVAFAPVGNQATSIPIGHAEFCKTHKAECRPNRTVVIAERLTEDRWRQLVEINGSVNASVVPMTDEDLYQTDEFWTYPNGYGDCEDIALEKRRELANAGWDLSTLLMTVVREPNGEGHAVLMVRTDHGDLVLDNQDGLVKVWTDTPYQYLKRQSQANPGQWVDIEDGRHAVVTVVASSN